MIAARNPMPGLFNGSNTLPAFTENLGFIEVKGMQGYTGHSKK